LHLWRTEPGIQQRANAEIRQGVKDVQALSTGADDIGFAQQSQVLGDVRLWTVKELLQMLDAELAFPEST